MGGEVARGHLGYRDHDRVGFQFSVNRGRRSAKPQLRFVKDRLWSVWSTGGENPLGGSPEGPRRPGRWTFLRKEVIEVKQKPIVSWFREGWPA